ncbi:MAG: hypothetical protein GPJ51_07350 [Candidatus Heimdallarchaeota archaeon]|nr:hypothetical protein [Candidatus Heimdallarchaeota archaeon]
MKSKSKSRSFIVIILITTIFLLSSFSSINGYDLSAPIIADHSIANMVRLDEMPDSAIITAKNTLHIAYQHTSHGSQIIDGMNALPAFKESNGGTTDLYDYNSSFLHDGAMSSVPDVGYPGWDNATRDYLDNPANSDCNVIMWSWCGQASSQTEQTMIDHYLDPMNQLEIEYPDVMFVYMTGHTDGTGLDGNLHLRNEQIRDFCISNNKILFDFADIESYDPDCNYFGDKNVNDNCDWNNGTHSGNWALDWQATHTEGVDWFSCNCAHSQALNGNMKAYAIWWLWAKLAGWEFTVSESFVALPIIFLTVCSFSIVIVSRRRR